MDPDIAPPNPLGALVRLCGWGSLLWLAHAHPELAPFVTGVVLGDFVTQIVAALLAAHRQPVQIAEAAISAILLAAWLHLAPFPARPDHVGTAALGFLAALAVRTLPAVWAQLHADRFPHA
ncbi:MAG: hypothetical protein R3F56_19950 [Planctomycetota bacterium]